jgi:hypothetical protein
VVLLPGAWGSSAINERPYVRPCAEDMDAWERVGARGELRQLPR